jgi:hypothetical protein
VRAHLLLPTMSSTKVIPIVDPAAVEYNRRIVLAATITVLVFSNASFVLRLIARRMQHQRLQADDYFMGLALPFSKLDLAHVCDTVTVRLKMPFLLCKGH